MNPLHASLYVQLHDSNHWLQAQQCSPCFLQHNDLYQMLLLEPKSLKKPSNHYDYSPNLISNSSTVDEVQFTLQNQVQDKDSKKKNLKIRKCTCKKSQCQKNYCQCFRLGLQCTSQCQCYSCCNKQKLFARRSSTQKVKCNCTKSKCLKNYCQCHFNGSKCGIQCGCSGCQNIQLLEDCLELGCRHEHGKKKVKLNQ